MTDSGRVYHSNRMCSHIKLSIFMVDGQKARKYPPCEKCVGNAAIPGNTFYLTEDGACYHSRLSCSGLKQECTVHRTVRGGFRRLYAVSEVRRRIKEVFMEIKHVCSLFLVVYPVYRDIKEKKRSVSFRR